MKQSIALASLVVVAVVVSFLGYQMGSRRSADVQGHIEEIASQVQVLQSAARDDRARLDRADQRIAEFEAMIEELKESTKKALAQRTETALAARTSDAPDAAGVSGGGEDELTEAERREQVIDDAFTRLFDEGVEWDEQTRFFKELAQAGVLDEVIAAYEERAADNPDDPDMQSELGEAYIQRLFHVTNDVEKGMYAFKADRAFDRALALDDHHWSARFTKAVSYSFQPPVLGMGPKAIKEFETLVTQQEARPASSPKQATGYAETYVYLGNLYAQQGKADKAREVWTKGFERHPESKSLRERLKD